MNDNKTVREMFIQICFNYDSCYRCPLRTTCNNIPWVENVWETYTDKVIEAYQITFPYDTTHISISDSEMMSLFGRE